MARDHLSGDLIAAGADFVRITDTLGLAARGGFWLRPHDLDLWRFALVTDLEDRAATTDPYLYLVAAFPEGVLPGPLLLDDIYSKSPSDPLFREVALRTSGALPDAPQRVDDLLVAGRRYDALVYRADPNRPSRTAIDALARTFAARVNARAATLPG